MFCFHRSSRMIKGLPGGQLLSVLPSTTCSVSNQYLEFSTVNTANCIHQSLQREKNAIKQIEGWERGQDNRCVEYFESSQGKRSDNMVKYKLIKSNQDVEIRIAQWPQEKF